MQLFLDLLFFRSFSIFVILFSSAGKEVFLLVPQCALCGGVTVL